MDTHPTTRKPAAAFRPAETIEEVVERLDAIIEACHECRSRIGYFPALYRRVTVEVKGRMEEGRFAHTERMEALDVIFASAAHGRPCHTSSRAFERRRTRTSG